MFDLAAIQQSLRDFGLDGWLLYDFRGSNVLARRVLDLEAKPAGSRRFFYMIPAHGRAVQAGPPDRDRGARPPAGRQARLPHLAGAGSGHRPARRGQAQGGDGVRARVSNPYVSKVDAGTVEVVRALGVEVVSSGDLIQQFEATWDDDQWRMHRAAEDVHDVGLRPGLGADRRARAAAAGRSARPRCRRRSWTISTATG